MVSPPWNCDCTLLQQMTQSDMTPPTGEFDTSMFQDPRNACLASSHTDLPPRSLSSSSPFLTRSNPPVVLSGAGTKAKVVKTHSTYVDQLMPALEALALQDSVTRLVPGRIASTKRGRGSKQLRLHVTTHIAGGFKVPYTRQMHWACLCCCMGLDQVNTLHGSECVCCKGLIGGDEAAMTYARAHTRTHTHTAEQSHATAQTVARPSQYP